MDPIRPVIDTIIAPNLRPESPQSTANGEFRDLLTGAIASVESQRAGARESVDRFLSGESEDIHKVALDTQKAELSFELFLQVRSKVISAYQEVMRMQI